MPTPAERKIARIPLIGKPIKRCLQFDRLAQNERVRHPQRYYSYQLEPLEGGGKEAIEAYGRRLDAEKKLRIELSRKRIAARAKRPGKKKQALQGS